MTTPDQELTELDKADLEQLYSDDSATPQFHTILEVWREVLKPAEGEALQVITPQWAARICAAYSQMTFADMPDYRDLYYSRILDLRDIVVAEIASDPDCLKWGTPEDDVEHNSTHYKNILLTWQKAVLLWELEWDCTSANANIDLAAISEVHKMFFGDQGLTAFLDNIKFEFDESDQEQLRQALEEMKAGVTGE